MRWWGKKGGQGDGGGVSGALFVGGAFAIAAEHDEDAEGTAGVATGDEGCRSVDPRRRRGCCCSSCCGVFVESLFEGSELFVVVFAVVVVVVGVVVVVVVVGVVSGE